MKHTKKSGGLSKGKIRGKSRSRAFCATAILLMLVPVVMLFAHRDAGQKPQEYVTQNKGDAIDFADPEISIHTADDGVIVIDKAKTPLSYSNTAPTADTSVRITSDPATIRQADTSPTHSGFTLPVPMDGESIGVLTTPYIGLSVRVYEGEDEMELMEKGVAHFRHTSAWQGNIGLSAHNINLDGTLGHFLNIHKLKGGSVIHYETALGTREYVVQTIKEISEMDWSMLNRTEDNRLTLITCITGKPDKRLVV